MQTFVMLTCLTSEAVRSPRALEELERTQHVRDACPHGEWIGSYAVLGPYDYVDIFRAPNLDTATKVSAIVRTYGHAQTENLGGHRMGLLQGGHPLCRGKGFQGTRLKSGDAPRVPS